MTDPNDQFFTQFGSSYGSSTPPTLGASRSNPVPLVKAWSNDLNSLNNPRYTNVAYVMGRWMPQLTTATRNFQTDQGIGVDGKVGPNTRAAMTRAKAALVSSTPVASTSPSPSTSTTSTTGDAVVDDDTPLSTVSTQLPVPFLEQEAWSGGPSMGATLTIGGVLLGGLGLVVTLLKVLRPSPIGATNKRD